MSDTDGVYALFSIVKPYDSANVKPPSGEIHFGTNTIRRPTRGIVLKPDTYATLQVISAKDGSRTKLVDAGSRYYDTTDPTDKMTVDGMRATKIYSNFMIQAINQERMEKQQIVETFGEPYIFLFGERPHMITVQGILMNTADFNWQAEWWHNYEEYLRGTKCVETDSRVFLSFDTTMIGGYIVSTNSSNTAVDRHFVTFQFTMFVTDYFDLSNLGNPSADPEIQYTSGIGTQGAPLPTDVERPKPLDNWGLRNIALTDKTPVDENNRAGQTLEKTIQSMFKSTVLPAIRFMERLWSNTVGKPAEMQRNAYVRVPVGFAGTMAYDQESNIELIKNVGATTVKFSTYEDNFDEYVGTYDQYASSNARSITGADGVRRSLNFGGYNDAIAQTEGEKLVKRATEVWAKFGIAVPKTQTGTLWRFLANGITGAYRVGATKAWTYAGAVAETAIRDGKVSSSTFVGAAKGPLAGMPSRAGRVPKWVAQALNSRGVTLADENGDIPISPFPKQIASSVQEEPE